MKRQIENILPFIIVAVAGFFVQGAFGADSAALVSADKAIGIFDTLSQYPLFNLFVTWLVTELGVRRFPSWSPTSTLYLIEKVAGLGIVLLTAVQRVARAVREHGFLQNVKSTPLPSEIKP